MKKTVVALLCLMLLGIGKTSFSQDDKKFKFGLRVTPSIDWYSPSEKKKFESTGSLVKFGFGMVMDFRLSENIWFSTGVAIRTSGGKIKFSENPTDSIGYYIKDNEIVEPSDGKISTFFNNNPSADFVRINERTYNANYVDIPLHLKMKTNEIGSMTYFGEFGLDLSVKTKGRADDDGDNQSSSNSLDLNDLTIDSEMQPLLLGLNFGLGTEYNLSGSTSIYGSLNFHYGFLNTVKKTSKHMVDWSQSNFSSDELKMYDDQQFKPFGLGLTVGVLF